MRAPVDVPRLRDYLVMLGRAWLLILVATVVSAGAAVAAVELRAPKYAASDLMFATVAGDSSVFALWSGQLGANNRIPTYTLLAKSDLVVQRTIDQLKLPTTAGELASRITADWEPGGANPWGRAKSALLRVTVTGRDPASVVKEVNGIASNLMAVSRELEWHESKVTDEIQYKGASAELVPVYAAPAAHVVPTPIRRPLVLGAGMGFGISVVLLLAVEIARDTVLTRGQFKYIVNNLATHGNT